MMIGVGAGLTNSCRIHRWLIYVDNISDIHTANWKLIVFMWPGLFNMSLVWKGRGYDVGGDPGNPWKASISLHQCLTCDGTRGFGACSLAPTAPLVTPTPPLTPSIPQNTRPVHIAVVFYAHHKSKKKTQMYRNTLTQKREYIIHINEIQEIHNAEKYKMLKAPRVPIAVVFSAPQLPSPLSQRWSSEMSNPLYMVENVVFYRSSHIVQITTGCVWFYIRIVRWLERWGEEEGRSNRDLIEWLPGKLLYSRFLLTTCRCLLECADVGNIRWAHCRTPSIYPMHY